MTFRSLINIYAHTYPVFLLRSFASEPILTVVKNNQRRWVPTWLSLSLLISSSACRTFKRNIPEMSLLLVLVIMQLSSWEHQHKSETLQTLLPTPAAYHRPAGKAPASLTDRCKRVFAKKCGFLWLRALLAPGKFTKVQRVVQRDKKKTQLCSLIEIHDVI